MINIILMNVTEMDLNLFSVLDAVLSERSVTLAAKRLNVTQSAVSNSLARLREILSDPLVVRNGRGLTLTPRAESLAPMVSAGLKCLKSALQETQQFLPDETTRTFTLAAADSQQVCDVPLIAERISRSMPHAYFRVVSPDFLLSSDGLATGKVDVALGPAIPVDPPIYSAHFCKEHGALAVKADHSQLKRRRISKEQFNLLQHIDVEIAQGRTGTGHRIAEEIWSRQGLKRTIALSVPNFTAAAIAAAHTEHIAAIPLRTAKIFARMLPLKILEPEFELPSIDIAMSWHARTHLDDGARYFRQLMLDSRVERKSSRHHIAPAV
jgi:DNA-binding transcriptional LysR family regulator